MEIQSKEISIVPIDSIMPWEKNANYHPPEQIQRLCEIIQYQGFRIPLIVDRATNEVVAGCGRLMAAKEMGLKEVPVIFEDFKSYDQKYAFMVSDNAITSWAILDFATINVELKNLELPNIELLGIKNFTVDIAEKNDPNKEWVGMPEFDQGDAMGVKQIIVHFATEQDVLDFCNLVKQKITNKTKYIWFPEQEIASQKDVEYSDDES